MYGKDFNIRKTELQYSNEIDPNVEFYSPFIATSEGVLYNRVINNHVYILDKDGIDRHYRFDFGNNRVVSYMNKEIYPEYENDATLTDEVKKAMDEEGFVLCLSKLK